MSTIIDTKQQPYSSDEIAQIKMDFYRDGFRLIPGVLDTDEVAALKAGADRIFEDAAYEKNRNSAYIAVRSFETDPMFVDMVTREPIMSLVESILGWDCHLVAQNIVRNRPGEAIDFFHADDIVILPVAEGMDRHDARLQMPVFIMTVQIPLTDIPSVEYGPSEFVPGSHYSGRHPNDTKAPVFEGKGAVPILCNAGDIYLHNGQCWHRGAPNTSDRTRYLLQQAYSMRWVSQRFFPFVNYQLPREIMESGDDRLLRVMGIHPTGAYG